MNPDDLIEQAKHLAGRSPRKPRQADLRRAVSAAYYAVFHTLCRDCADMMIGVGPSRRSSAWARVYRCVPHKETKTRCQNVKAFGELLAPQPVPPELRRFASAFPNLLENRHRADYDPHATLSKSEVLGLIETADEARKDLLTTDKAVRKAFASYILVKPIGS